MSRPKDKDLAYLLRCAAAALETPGDLSAKEKDELIEDLVVAAWHIHPEEGEKPAPPAA